MPQIEIARLFRFVREGPQPNSGPWVEAIQRVTGNKKGDAWCASFVSMVLAIRFNGKNPLPMTASCDVMLRFARARRWLDTEPFVGDVFLVMKRADDAIHTGFVTAVYGNPDRFDEISGNTNPFGGREGYGVFERSRIIAPGKYLFIRIPRVVPE